MTNQKRNLRKIILFASGLLMLLTIGGLWLCYKIVSWDAKGILYSDVKEVPHNRVGLVLGTSKYVAKGQVNLFYRYRIEAAGCLFNAGKIDYLLVSGDNRHMDYNEPVTMKKDLMDQGIPEERIYLDYAGFRTLDSVVRSQKVFGQDSITVISQKFHNERALFIAGDRGISAIGFNARDVDKYWALRTQVREVLARVKLMLDLYVLNKQPRFLGKEIEIGKPQEPGI